MNRMLSSTTIELISRVRKSFNEYFNEIPDDHLHALAINPLLITCGCADIIALKGEAGMRLVERAKLLLKKFIQRFAPSAPEAENERSVDSDTPDGECG